MPIIQAKVDYLKQFETQQPIDVLFIGNSTVQAGVSPALFDQLRRHTGAFNAAIEGLPPYGVNIFLRIFDRYSKPQTIIYGITPQDLNSNSPWARDVTERVKESPLALAEANYGWQGRLYAFLLEHSMLFRYRWTLHQSLLRGRLYSPLPEPYFDERGYDALENRLSEVPQAQRTRFVNRAGVLNYNPYGAQVKALREIIEYCQAHDIRLILVNMPLADDYFQNFDSPEDYERYMEALQSIAEEYGTPLWDLSGRDGPATFEDQFFADFNHLNAEGATRLTEMLADRYQQWSASLANGRLGDERSGAYRGR